MEKLKLRSLYALLSTKQAWSDKLIVNDTAVADLNWWFIAVDSWNGSPLYRRPAECQVWTDASNTGWGCACGNEQASGKWDPSTIQDHINFKELLTVLFALKSFVAQLPGRSVQILSDNVTAVAYVNNMVGHVHELTVLAERIWATVVEHNVILEMQHMPGSNNQTADRLSLLPVQYNWRLHPQYLQCRTECGVLI